MNTSYQSSNPVRTMVAIAFAVVLSGTCVLGAIAPAAMQSSQNGSLVALTPSASPAAAPLA